MRRVIIVLFIVAGMGTSSAAVDAQLVAMRPMAGSPNIQFCRAIVSSTGEFTGILSYSLKHSCLLLDRLGDRAPDSIRVRGVIGDALCRMSGDTLDIYVASHHAYEIGELPLLTRIRFLDGEIGRDTIYLEDADLYNHLDFGYPASVKNMDIDTAALPGGGIVAGFEFDWLLCEMTMGCTGWYTSKAKRLSWDLAEVEDTIEGYKAVPGFFDTDGYSNWVSFSNSYEWRIDDPDNGYYYSRTWVELPGTFLMQSLANGWSDGLWVGDLDEAYAGDEIVYFGTNRDLAGEIPGLRKYVACYSIVNNSVATVWYDSTRQWVPLGLHPGQHKVVGVRGGPGSTTVVTFADYSTGLISATADLGRKVWLARLFHFGFGNPGLVGASADTLFAYGFDVATGIDEPIGEPVLQGFELTQNHPNPFNGHTSVTFEIPVRSSVKAAIYNLLGQQVRVLADQEYSPGGHVLGWDGTDSSGKQVSTGIYLLNVQAQGAGKSVRMLYLK